MSDFWEKNPAAWAAVTKDPRNPKEVMDDFANFLWKMRNITKRRPVAVCAPVGYDFSFVRYYMARYLNTDAPLGHSAIDVKTLVADRLKLPYYDAGKRNYPRHWLRDSFEHTHVAVEDAVEQGWIFCRILEGD